MFWYNDEVTSIENQPVKPKSTNKKRIVFYGSSSLRLWSTLETDFTELDIVNQAFGGSTLAACCWFFKRLIPIQAPDAMVIYAGDNDLGDGRHPEEVFLFFKNMMALIQQNCGDIPVAFVSIKPSLSRQYLSDSVQYTNKIIKDEIDRIHPNCTFVAVYNEMLANGLPDSRYYQADGLHLSEPGYQLWKEILREKFLFRFIQSD
ncbi:MAG: GDSL-type esterase/lipase family protein [Bacteroidota bacterium]